MTPPYAVVEPLSGHASVGSSFPSCPFFGRSSEKEVPKAAPGELKAESNSRLPACEAVQLCTEGCEESFALLATAGLSNAASCRYDRTTPYCSWRILVRFLFGSRAPSGPSKGPAGPEEPSWSKKGANQDRQEEYACF
jgi:hypothetical protein